MIAAVLAAGGVAASRPPTSSAARPTSASACQEQDFRTVDQAANVSVARGIYGVMRTPNQGEITGAGTDRLSAATLNLIHPGVIDFVQIGWYVGSDRSNQLPTVSTPHMFVGEYTGGSSVELLRQGSPLQWSTYYTFSIHRHEIPGAFDDFYFYLNGVFRTSTVYLHEDYNWPVFNGEVNYSCTAMAARAYRSSAPYSTLQYLVHVNGTTPTWFLFYDLYDADPPYNIGDLAGYRATAYGYGP